MFVVRLGSLLASVASSSYVLVVIEHPLLRRLLASVALRPLLKDCFKEKDDDLVEPTPMVDSDDDSNAPAAPYITLEQQMAMEEKLEEEIAKNNGSAYVEGIHSIIGTSCDPERCWSMVDAIFTER